MGGLGGVFDGSRIEHEIVSRFISRPGVGHGFAGVFSVGSLDELF